MAQGQSVYKSHLPLLNALERVPMSDWSTDFSQAWALGKGARPHSWNVPTPFTRDTLMAYSLMQHKLPSPPLGLSDAHNHVCALWMHHGSSLRPGLLAEPWYTPTGPRMLLTGTGKAAMEQWRGSGHQAQSVWVWSKYYEVHAKARACPHIIPHGAELMPRPAFGRSAISQEHPMRSLQLLSRALLWIACAPTL